MSRSYIDKLAFIEVQTKKVLVTLSKGKDTWYIPGGKRENGETNVQALSREVREELAVELIPSSIQKFGVFEAQAHGMPKGTIVRMACYTAKYTGKLTPSAEIAELEFFPYSSKHRCSPVDGLIFDDLFAKKIIE